MDRLADLVPTQKCRVIDLVQQAGVDVSDWSNSTRGEPGASTNPKYCYEWAFTQPQEVVVLNLWHAEMEEIDHQIIRRGNFREDAAGNRSSGQKSAWGKRAARLDAALKLAAAQDLTIRVIINAGVQRSRDVSSAVASKVAHRHLDPLPWHIADYATSSGDHVLVRGAVKPRFIDQFAIWIEEGGQVPTRDRRGSEFVRDPRVRNAVLSRAAGKCEHCEAAGFRMANGSVYLETHHVVPLSEGGADSVHNVIALCPDHHREAHHGETREDLRISFQAALAQHH